VAFIDLPFALIFFLVIGWIAPMMLIPLFIGAAVLLLYALAVKGACTRSPKPPTAPVRSATPP